MNAAATDWRALWASGDLGRFCFISLGILLHATNETMVPTIMPGMVHDIDGVQLVGWSLATYEVGSIIAGAAAGRLVSYLPLRTNMAGAALVYAAGAAVCALAPGMEWLLAGRLLEGIPLQHDHLFRAVFKHIAAHIDHMLPQHIRYAIAIKIIIKHRFAVIETVGAGESG